MENFKGKGGSDLIRFDFIIEQCPYCGNPYPVRDEITACPVCGGDLTMHRTVLARSPPPSPLMGEGRGGGDFV